MIKLYAMIAVASLAMSGASYLVGGWRGYNRGEADTLARLEVERKKTQRELFSLGERVSMQALDLIEAQNERQSLVDEIESQALSAPGASIGGISDDGMRRLEQRWRSR